ncbi:ABC-three component system protein [Myxococcus hansupus]|uniref:ABC-three component system protein n=1 Tax=Pseudomyxococcus hansupus TaxID=1297742 RepID=UPI0005D0EE0E|nr:ABC-three component system protein [Myxococcus hansupus]
MDPNARAFYESRFEIAFLRKKGEAFQDFFSTIMEMGYPSDFQRVRPWGRLGDRKNDGYLGSKRMLFQVYAPNELASAETVRKIHEDFTEALPYWKAHFSTWVFVHNAENGLGPAVLKKLLELEAANSHLKVLRWGFEQLRAEVFLLPESSLARLFGPAPTAQSMDALGISDLRPILEHIPRLPAPSDADLRPVPADKLQRNLLSEHAADLLKLGMRRASLVGRYFDARPDPTERDAIAQALRVRYEELRRTALSPDQVFAALQEFVHSVRAPTPAQHAAVVTVLAYFFEECDIFERTPQQAESVERAAQKVES